jgi:hypothetical protein
VSFWIAPRLTVLPSCAILMLRKGAGGFSWEQPGGVSERFKEPVLKTGDSTRAVGSNPTPSAKKRMREKCGEMAEPVEGGRLLSD